MDSAERSRKRAQRWSKRKAVVVHLAVCFVVGAFAPLVATRGPFLPFGGVQRVAPPSPPAAPDIGLLLVVTVTRPDEDGMLQEASLTRLGHTLRLVPPPLVWIVVGAENRSSSTVQVLRSTGVMFRHLTYAVGKNNATNTTTAVNIATNNNTGDANATAENIATNKSTTEASTTNTTTTAEKNGTNNTIVETNDTDNNTVEANATNNTTVEASATNTTTAAEKKSTNNTIVENNATNNNRNASEEADLQRNVALSHIERHRLAGVIHFAAPSAIYDLRFFEELRQTRGVAAWPTATVSSADQRVTLQGPTCNSSQITGWYSKASGTNETHRAPVAAAQDAGAIYNSSGLAPEICISGLGFRSSILWESERFINSNSSSGGSSQDFIQLVRQMAVGDGRKSIPSDCSESRVMMWHLNMPKYTPEGEERETPQEQSLLEEDEEDYMA
ncbi:hypothetical protein D1007_05434 [Hordeum vulgare]|uniref:Glycosyltransferases n=1 Tax=Hordeum vulgare subsp. vulgare TaxID=112509 RepID=A0A8I6X5I3_HORVV|nr:probable glucuronosyltransferase Os01g0157700 [Hordeum vulgare subsp. vulgare]KAE8816885.1 hypothetical protein D1007_05434 [Hordeum vulgare]